MRDWLPVSRFAHQLSIIEPKLMNSRGRVTCDSIGFTIVPPVLAQRCRDSLLLEGFYARVTPVPSSAVRRHAALSRSPHVARTRQTARSQHREHFVALTSV